MPSFNNKIIVFALLADLFVISICLLMTFFVFNLEEKHHVATITTLLWAFLIIGWYFTSKENNLYDEFSANTLNLVTELFKMLKSVLMQTVFISLFLFAVKYPYDGRKFALTYVALLLIILSIQKLLFKKLILVFAKSSFAKRNVLIIGAGDVGLKFEKTMNSNPHMGYNIIGFLDDQPKAFLNGKHLGKIDQINELLQTRPEIDEIIVALPNKAVDKVNSIVKIANNETVRVKIIPDYFHMISARYGISMMNGMPIITVRSEPLEEYHWRLTKRVFDVVFSIIMLIFVCSWLFPIIALFIKLDSKGPVFFTQARSGRNNVPFNCIKFRSMTVNSHANEIQATVNDTRLTKSGKLLRKTNLDELPQFINVLLGEMSVIGPRPHMIKHTEQYSKIVDGYLVRQLLKPGISGWAQVNGHRGETTHVSQMQKRIEYDLWYLENWTFNLDIKIIFLTFWNTMKGDPRAY